ncbi:MAG: type II toxin-antitoxin system RelB/DinJ family antitoxin [Treponema sp.]|nr:type II toxin-antitoxin system RelB/DinJ family antitoxin [Treponema sp.]
MQAQDVRVTIRVNNELKENAEALFEYLGLNMSNAINIFLRKAVDERGIPFTVNTGNRGLSGLSTNEITGAFNDAVIKGIMTKKNKGLPVARFDTELGRAYLENADGTREYV